MYPQEERRPAPVLVVLLILGILIFTLLSQGENNSGGGQPGGGPKNPAPALFSPTQAPQIVPTSVPVTPAAQETLEKIQVETRAQFLRATQMAIIQQQTAVAQQQAAQATAQAGQAQMVQAAVIQTQAAVYATETSQQMARDRQAAQIDQEQKITTAIMVLAFASASGLFFLALGLVIRSSLEAQRKASEAAQAQAEAELRLAKINKPQVETKQKPVDRPIPQPMAKENTKVITQPANGRAHHSDLTKQPAPEDKKVTWLPWGE